ncbi:MAG: hypothetical protein ABW128_16390 [Rhizorhabdus sp.]
MSGVAIRSGRTGGAVIGALLALTLLVRLIVPSGWMPVAGSGYAITLCTGAGVVSAWVDEKGVVHKDGKAPAQKADHPCTFAGFGVDLLSRVEMSVRDSAVRLAGSTIALSIALVAVGRGLAAPPPPQTGPPATL